jgi:hypothetical protein
MKFVQRTSFPLHLQSEFEGGSVPSHCGNTLPLAEVKSGHTGRIFHETDDRKLAF